MPHSETLLVDSAEKASRYLGGLGGSVGFDEAVRRIESKSSAEIRSKLQGLARWVRRESEDRPDPAFGLIGAVVRDAPASGDIGRAIAAADAARADARQLADHVRGSMLNGVNYLALLLIVAAIVASIWIGAIAPAFESLYTSVSSSLPGLSRLLADNAWIVVVAIGGLGLVLVALVLGARRFATAIETIAAMGTGLLDRIAGSRLRRAHERWRVLILAQAWSAAGEAPAEAVRRAADALGADRAVAGSLAAEMALAGELGSAQSELDHLSLTAVTAYRNALELWRAVVVRGLQLAVAIVIGILVIAIYLPIFQMGAII